MESIEPSDPHMPPEQHNNVNTDALRAGGTDENPQWVLAELHVPFSYSDSVKSPRHGAVLRLRLDDQSEDYVLEATDGLDPVAQPVTRFDVAEDRTDAHTDHDMDLVRDLTEQFLREHLPDPAVFADSAGRGPFDIDDPKVLTTQNEYLLAYATGMNVGRYDVKQREYNEEERGEVRRNLLNSIPGKSVELRVLPPDDHEDGWMMERSESDRYRQKRWHQTWNPLELGEKAGAETFSDNIINFAEMTVDKVLYDKGFAVSNPRRKLKKYAEKDPTEFWSKLQSEPDSTAPSISPGV